MLVGAAAGLMCRLAIVVTPALLPNLLAEVIVGAVVFAVSIVRLGWAKVIRASNIKPE